MKKNIALLLGLLLITCGSVLSKNLQAHLSYATFYSPEEGPYIETYLSINPKSVRYQQTEDGMYQATVNVTIMFKQNETVAAFEKYELNSPKLSDTTDIKVQFLDQKRFLLKNGEYSFDIILSDKNDDKDPYVITEPIAVNYKSDSISFSDVQLVDKYKKTSEKSVLTKSGYDLIPYPANYFPENKNNLIFYAELYNTAEALGTETPFLLKYYIRNTNNKKILENFVRIRRMESKPVHIVFHDFDISKLPSGNYNLIVEALDKENKTVARRTSFFQRSNPDIKLHASDLANVSTGNTFVSAFKNKDSLIKKINMLTPIATELEKSFIYGDLQGKQLEVLQRYFYTFWSERSKLNPEKKWQDYHMKVKIADKKFGTMVKEGYETDRGRVYLKYGPPNTISESHNDPTAYPYEIWHYYSTEKRRDSKFVFYTHDLVTNAYELVHSNVPGEITNRKWRIVVYGRGQQGENVDDEDIRDIWGQDDDWDIPY